jgi:DNA modification methylase
MTKGGQTGLKRSEIIHGHALEKLSELPADSVHCCITSPPYWGLRDYKLEPQVWDGEAGCGHEWVDETVTGELRTGKGLAKLGERYRGGGKKQGEVEPITAIRGQCRHCSAWRGSLGLEPTPELFVEHLVTVFREVRRVLRPDGVAFVNIGDSYASSPASGGERDTSGRPQDKNAGQHQRTPNREWTRPPGLKPKDLCMIPARVALALQSDGWWLRSEIVWAKPNPMPESVTDRPTKAHEMVYLLTKSARYFWDQEAVRERSSGLIGGRFGAGGHEVGRLRNDAARDRPEDNGYRNIRTVWTIPTAPFPEAHFATFPPALVEPMVKAGCPEGGTVLDPFAGAGTTGLVALRLNRQFVGIELNPDYCEMAQRRLQS